MKLTDGKADHPKKRDDSEDIRRRIRFPFGETKDGEESLLPSDDGRLIDDGNQSSDESSIVDALTWSNEDSQESLPHDQRSSSSGSYLGESSLGDSSIDDASSYDSASSDSQSDERSEDDFPSAASFDDGLSDEDTLDGVETLHRIDPDTARRIGTVDSAFSLDAIDSMESLDPVLEESQGAVTRSFDLLEPVGESSIAEANPTAWATETWEQRLDDDLRRTLEEIDENDVDTAVVEKIYDEAKDFIPLDLDSEIIDPNPSRTRGTDILVDSGSESGQFIDLDKPKTPFNELNEDENISEPIILVGEDDEYTESMRFGASIVGGSARVAGQISARRPAQPNPNPYDDVSDSGSYVDAAFGDGSFIAGTFVEASSADASHIDPESFDDRVPNRTDLEELSRSDIDSGLADDLAALRKRVAALSKEVRSERANSEEEKKRRKKLILLLLLFFLLLWPCSIGGLYYHFNGASTVGSADSNLQALINAKNQAERDADLARKEAKRNKDGWDKEREARGADELAYDAERAKLLANAKTELNDAIAATRKSLAAEVELASGRKEKDLELALANKDKEFEDEKTRLAEARRLERKRDAALRRANAKEVRGYRRMVEELQEALRKEKQNLDATKKSQEESELARKQSEREKAAAERRGDVVATLTKKSGNLSELRKPESGEDEGWDDEEGWDDGEDSGGGDDGWDDGDEDGWSDGEETQSREDDEVWGDEKDGDSWGDDGGSESEEEPRKHPVVEIWDWAKESIHGSIAYKNLTHFDDEDQSNRRFRRTRHEARGELEYKGPLVGPLSLYSEVYVQLDDDEYSNRVVQDHENRSKRRPKVSFDELYILGSVGSLDVRAGFQTIAWGTGDLQNPTDNFNPRDISDLFDNKKMGVLAARLNYYIAEFELEGIVVPFFTPTRIPPNQKRFSPAIPSISIPVGAATVTPNLFITREFPDEGDAVQFGGRISRSLGGWDFSASYYDGFNKIPLTRVQAFQGGVGANGLPDLSLVTELFYEKIRVYGFDFATTLGWLDVEGFVGDVLKKTQIHGEGAYFDSREKTGDDYIQYVLGINYTFNNVIADHDIVLLLDYLDEVLIDEREILGVEDLLTNLSPQLQAIAAPFIPTINATIQERAELARGFRGSISSRLSYQFSDTFQFVFTSIFVLRGKENLFFQSKMVWDITDNLRFEAGHDYFSGPRETFFGQYRDNDRVFFVGKISF